MAATASHPQMIKVVWTVAVAATTAVSDSSRPVLVKAVSSAAVKAGRMRSNQLAERTSMTHPGVMQQMHARRLHGHCMSQKSHPVLQAEAEYGSAWYSTAQHGIA